MGHEGHFQFLRISQCHLLKKCFKKAVKAFKVWASKGITASSEWVQKSTVRNPNFESLDQCQIFAKSISLIFVVNGLFLSFKIAILEICLKKDWTNFEKKLRFGILNSLSLSLSLSSPPPPKQTFWIYNCQSLLSLKTPTNEDFFRILMSNSKIKVASTLGAQSLGESRVW